MNYADLKPEELRIAVATRLGWTGIRNATTQDTYVNEFLYGCVGSPAGIPPGIGATNVENMDPLPHFEDDLNACHKFEKTLDDGAVWRGYLNCLWDVVCPQFNQMNGLNTAVGLLLVHATARQRCEAFLAATEPEEKR